MTDTRPIVYCHRCEQDVVAMQNGLCPWCDKRLHWPVRHCACGARVTKNRTTCPKCDRTARRARLAMHNLHRFSPAPTGHRSYADSRRARPPA